MRRWLSPGVAVYLLVAGAVIARADDEPHRPALSVPEGFSIELVAGPPLVERPIVASFDEQGRLYVAESSGSNDPVNAQLEQRPHRIVRLEDADGDGRYDKRIVFADRMMFPEGVMWRDGSVYVSAPPSIWKLTDTNGDGVAEERVEWFQGKTLTGCANDLHGPYAGPDGWIYWCKGAFAEQTHTVNGRPWTTKAAHIFRCRADGSGFEPVITGGMDNPVDVAFTPDGEPILSATYLKGDGRVDGLVHAVYGGVWGKPHGVLDGHPRTGELMPALVAMTPAAPCGLERYDSDAFGGEYRDNLFCANFNLRKVKRHELRPAGSTFASRDSDFVSSDDVDFHPTDVLVDADGSLLVVDTGGWYKLCCPTSQLWKPDVLGGIYRVRRVGAKAPATADLRPEDPRGRKVEWAKQTVAALWKLAGDPRPGVSERAIRGLVTRRETPELKSFLEKLNSKPADAILDVEGGEADAERAALARSWVLVRIDTDGSRAAVRRLLEHSNEHVRHVALHGVSLVRDAVASEQLQKILGEDLPANRRAAAEALGRIGDRAVVRALLAAASKADDRMLQHSLIYALIELDDVASTAEGLRSDDASTRAVAAIALDQMAGGKLEAEQLVPWLSSSDRSLQKAATWLVGRHPEWGGALVQWFREQLASISSESGAGDANPAAMRLETMLVRSADDGGVRALIGETLANEKAPAAARRLALRAIARAKRQAPPQAWGAAIATILQSGDTNLAPAAIAAARAIPPAELSTTGLDKALVSLADGSGSPELRISALATLAAGGGKLTSPQFALLVSGLSVDSLSARAAAAEALSQAALTAEQFEALATAIKSAAPLELNRLLTAFEQCADDKTAGKLLVSLRNSPALAAVRVDLLRQALAHRGPEIQRQVDELESLVNVDAAGQRKRIEELLPRMASGDVRRGHAVFYSAKAACTACHKLGNAGGLVGPELSHIGQARTERDLLESILFPSLSFVRANEPVLIVTSDGKAINGRVRDETKEAYIVTTGPNQEVVIPRSDVEEIKPSTVSVMPAGLDKQLSEQELADLVAFLRNAK
jgi:putative membrane-bound dehydrogenase-like protein